MKLHLIIFFFCALIPFSLFCQSKFEKKIKYINGYQTFSSDVLQINHYYYITGLTQKITVSRGSIFKIDTNGNLVKAIYIGKLNNALGLVQITKTSKNEIIVTGTTNKDYSVGELDFIIIKLDTNLNIKWFKSIGGNFVDAVDYLTLKELKDGSFLCLFSTNSYGIGYPLSVRGDIFICQLDSSGNLIWSKTLGTIGGDYANDFQFLSDSSMIIIGSTQIDTNSYFKSPTIIKINKNGNIDFSRIIYFTPEQVSGDLFYILGVENDNIYVCGYLMHDLPPSCYRKFQLVLFKIDKNGNILKYKLYNSTTNPCNYSIYSNSSIVPHNYSLLNKEILLEGIYYNSSYNEITRFGSKRFYINIDTSLNYKYCILHNTPYIEYSSFSPFWALNSLHLYNYRSLVYSSGGITTTPTFTDLTLLSVKFDSTFNSCSPSIPLPLEEDTLPSYTIISNTYSITSINQGTVLSWTPAVVEGGYDSTICFCPDIPLTISKNPVTCFSNGSATITPQNNGNYSYIWNPPVSATNTASNLPAGNYTITTTDSTGCNKTTVITITTNFNLPLSITGNSLICSSQTATLTLHGAQSLTWNTGQTDSIIVVQPSVTTTYSAVVVNGSCQDSVYFTVNVLPSPSVSVTPTTYTLNIGDTAVVQLSGATYYSWNPAFGVVYTTSATAYITPTASAMYCVTGTDSSKVCADTSCVQLYVEGSCFDIRVPNVFTPNGDNVNDDWGIEIPCISLVNEFHLNIVDRWGVKIYEANKPNARWDGRTISGEPVPTGTYYYTVEFKINNKKEKLKGYITLMK
ncbi:MAG: gliding motility-associated C-terminal domain-containing protein [Bacteroidota bacterium]